MAGTLKFWGVALLAAGAMLLEIGLTRLFSVLYYPPYVFVVLSLAVLGIGLGAGLVALRPQWLGGELAASAAAGASVGAALLPVVLLFLPPVGRSPVHLALLVLPFFAVGITLAAVFSGDAHASPALYRADLTGAGAGALAAASLFDMIGVVNGVLAAALLLALAALCLARHTRVVPLAAVAGALALLVMNAARPLLQLDWQQTPTAKPIVSALTAGGQPLAERWDSFARTDLIDPGNERPYELYMDGAAGSVMPPAAGDPALWRDIGLFPFATEQPGRVFIIGPGGGADVWFALQGRAETVVAAEVNRASVELVNAFADYTGDLYARPEVRVVVDEGRHVLEREGETYDLIFLSHVLTLAAERTGFALIENRALTVEAFATYLGHLRPGGQLAVKLYDEPTLTRALATALAVLTAQGMDDAEALTHIMVFVDPAAEPAIPLLLVRNTPYSRDDSLSLGAVAREVGFTPLLLPHVLANPPLDAVVSGERTLAAVLAESDSNLQPATDDRPFFYLFERGLPAELRQLLWVLLVVVLLGAAVVLWQGRLAPEARLPAAPLYFALLGMGFMLVEIALIQQVQGVLGHPTQAVTVVLAGLLVIGGIGSGYFGQRSAGLPFALPVIVTVTVAVAIGAWLLLWPRLAAALVGAGEMVRMAAALLALGPLGFLMGAPFPLGLAAVGRRDPRHVALAWSVNGVMSVVGSTLGVALAVLAGYQAVLAAAALVYLAASGVAQWLGRGAADS